ncbi:hypothetical protein ACFVWN_01360 [Nocardiopsis flavescens]|uniref:hypothetical protein n=1 Tax=Nocardiopsis flavescens TaxID=758803 RepID=UPI003650A843
MDRLPAQIRHLEVLGSRRSSPAVTITPLNGNRYRIEVDFAPQDKRATAIFVRRGRRWIPTDIQAVENGHKVAEADFTDVMRQLSSSGDRVGTPAEHTRHPGANPTLVTRSHTIIRN